MIPWLSLVRCSKSWFIISFFFQNSRLDVRQRFCPIRVESFLGFLFVFFCSGFSPFFFLFFFQFSLFVFFFFSFLFWPTEPDTTFFCRGNPSRTACHRLPKWHFFLPCFNIIFRILLGFTGFYWVLSGFTGFYWVLLGFNGFYLVLLGITESYWVLLG